MRLEDTRVLAAKRFAATAQRCAAEQASGEPGGEGVARLSGAAAQRRFTTERARGASHSLPAAIPRSEAEQACGEAIGDVAPRQFAAAARRRAAEQARGGVGPA